MISPTGKGIRSDRQGDGHYGASRGHRLHNGIDYECIKGQKIIAPFDMRIVRIAKPYFNSDLSGIVWQHGASSGKMFYFLPKEELIGSSVKQGENIGKAQAVNERYDDGMINHIHFQIDK